MKLTGLYVLEGISEGIVFGGGIVGELFDFREGDRNHEYSKYGLSI